MKASLIFVASSFSLLAACASQGERDEVVQADHGVNAATCTAHEDEGSCLAERGCAWGDLGGPSHECVYVGEIVVGAPAVAPPCVNNDDEDACLAETGCAWGDFGGPSHACVYVGEIVVGLPTPAPTPSPEPEPSTRCAAVDEDACLAEPGCAWGDLGGPSHECVYIGEVVPE